MVITGDPDQIDLPRTTPSGLVQAARILAGDPAIGIARFGAADVVRHPLVQRILEAYAANDCGTRPAGPS
jgi:phosphate starvation-inducible PhoH-like protein